MKNFLVLILTGILMVFAGCGREEPHSLDHATDAAHDMHDDHAAEAVAPTLQPGQRWPTDEPLREAMLNIRAAVEKVTPAYERGQLDVSDAQALAGAVDQNVKYMIANCKLAPEPDAALHVLIGRMLNAAAALQKSPAEESGVPQLLAVLREYQATFDHPGWLPMASAPVRTSPG